LNGLIHFGPLRAQIPVLLAEFKRCYTRRMRVLGIDCGGQYTGYGVVEMAPDHSLVYIASGAVSLRTRDPLCTRLLHVSRELREIIERHRPDVAAIEDVFYAVNVKSALKLGEVRGVAMMTAASCGLPVTGYAPLAIKSAVVGYGRAEKSQVQDMVARLLRLAAPPEPADAADALAIAICHLHTAATLAAFQR
jgi:crossover junction endodeoxyribonuclease RuvC